MILGEQVRLRGIEQSDLPRFVTWLNDAEVRQHLLVHLPLSLADEEVWFEQMSKQPAEEHPLVIEVKTAEGWTPIGNTSFHNLNWRDRSAEFGIFIGEKRFWNQGYGSEAIRLMLQHGFNNLNLYRIYLHVYETNPRAIRAYERAGFVQEGRLRHGRFLNGHYIDVLLMAILRPEWQETVK